MPGPVNPQNPIPIVFPSPNQTQVHPLQNLSNVLATLQSRNVSAEKLGDFFTEGPLKNLTDELVKCKSAIETLAKDPNLDASEKKTVASLLNFIKDPNEENFASLIGQDNLAKIFEILENKGFTPDSSQVTDLNTSGQKNLPPLTSLAASSSNALRSQTASNISATQNVSAIQSDLPPIAPDGSALFTYQNNSGLPDDQIYITVTGTVPSLGQCIIQFDSTGKPTYIPATSNLKTNAYSYPLSMFPKSLDGSPTFYLPKVPGGGRVYTSVGQPLTFTMAPGMVMPPDPGVTQDPNNKVLWDKMEYTVDNSTVFLNVTSVDNFSLPIGIQETINGVVKTSGHGAANREELLNTLRDELTQAGGPWPSLIKTVPGTDVSRVTAPMYGLTANYLTTSQNGQPSWMDKFRNVFSQNDLMINEAGALWRGRIDPATNVITFQREGGSSTLPNSFQLTLPTNTNSLLSNNKDAWKLPYPPKNANEHLLWNVAGTLEAGIESNTLTTTEAMDRGYFTRNRDKFYQVNPDPNMPNFIDYYSKVIHSFGEGYTYPYDDHLNAAGEVAANPLSTFGKGSIILGPLKLS